MSAQLDLYSVVALRPTFNGCNIEGGCITEVHYTLYTGTHPGCLYREVAATIIDVLRCRMHASTSVCCLL